MIKENTKREGSYIEFIKSGDRGEAEKNKYIISINIDNIYDHGFFDSYWFALFSYKEHIAMLLLMPSCLIFNVSVITGHGEAF